MDGLADYMGGLSGNMDTLRTDIGTVASHVESLSSKTEKQNQKLQQDLTKEMQGLFSEFKTSITGVIKSDTQGNANAPQSSPPPRNVRYASSTRYQTHMDDTTSVRDRADDSKNMA